MRRREFFGSLSGAMAWPFAARAQQPSTSGTAVKGADIFLQKSRNASIVQNGDDLGRIVFQGSNGTTFDTGAIIMAEVDGTPGASADMPTRLVFLTAPDGSATPIQRMRINANGEVRITQPDNVIALDIHGGAHTQDTPIIDVAADWNNGSKKHTAIKADISDSASGSTSQLLTLQINGDDRFAVQKDGTVLIGGHVRRGSPVTKTNDFTVADTENWLICNKGSSLTVTLPSAASYIFARGLEKGAARGFGRFSHFEIFPTLLLAMGYDAAWVNRSYGPSLMDSPSTDRKFMIGNPDSQPMMIPVDRNFPADAD